MKSLLLLLSLKVSANRLASPFNSLILATGKAISSDGIVITAISSFWNAVWSFIMNLIYMVCKWALNIIDLFEILAKKMAGIDTQSTSKSYLTLNNPIFKFLLSDTMITIYWSILGISIALLIVFTIIAIVKAQYTEAIESSDKVKSRVYKSALRSLFLFLIVPIIIIGSIMFSNAVLNGFYHALTGKNYQASTMGGQIFVASSYDANRFRQYADNNMRIPILLNFDDPSNDIYLSSYSTEELVSIYESWTNGGEIYKMFAKGTFPAFEDTTTYINGTIYNTSSYSKEFESFVCTREQYYILADFFDFAVKNDIHFYYKSATDKNVNYLKQNVTKDGNIIKTQIEGFSRTSSSITVTYKGINNNETTVRYNIGPNNNSTPMQDALTVIYQLLGLGDFSNYTFNYLSNATSSSGTVDWTCEQALVFLDGTLKFYPVYKLTLNEYSERLGTYITQQESIKGILLDNGTTFVRVNDSPNLDLETISNGANTTTKAIRGTRYYAIYGYNYIKNFETIDGKISYTGLSNSMLLETANESGIDDYYSYEIINRKVSYPEKILRDLNAIYGNINFENFINTDSWSEALGEYISKNLTTSGAGNFNTSLIHPLGLILSEIFLGKVEQTEPNTSGSKLKFTSLYSENSISALIKTICGEDKYKNVYAQLKYYTEFFNQMMVPVLDELAYYEDFDILDIENDGAKLYTYRAYLASLLFSKDLCNYFVSSSDTILNAREMINDLSYAENVSVFYDFETLKHEHASQAEQMYIPFFRNNGSQETSLEERKKTVFWQLVYNYFNSQGLTDDEIDEKFRNSLGRLTQYMNAPEYLNAFARYVGNFSWTNDTQALYNYFTNVFEGVLNETLLDSETASEYNANYKKMQKTIKEIYDNYFNNSVVTLPEDVNNLYLWQYWRDSFMLSNGIALAEGESDADNNLLMFLLDKDWRYDSEIKELNIKQIIVDYISLGDKIKSGTSDSKEFNEKWKEAKGILQEINNLDNSEPNYSSNLYNLSQTLKDILDGIQDGETYKVKSYDALLSLLRAVDNSNKTNYYDVVVTLVENLKKCNQTDKYNIIDALQTYIQNAINGTYKIAINGKYFNTQLNMTVQKYIEFLKGNQTFATSLLPKLNSNIKIKYSNLSSYEQEKLDKAVELSSQYKDTNIKWYFYIGSMEVMEDDATFQNLYSAYKQGEVLPVSNDPNSHSQFYIRAVDSNGDDILNPAEKFWEILYNAVADRYVEEDLIFVENDYTGILTQNGNEITAFKDLRDFIDGFGSLCFNLNNKTSFSKLLSTFEDNVNGEAFVEKLSTYLENRKLTRAGSSLNLNKIENAQQFLEYLGIEFDLNSTDENGNSIATLQNVRLEAMKTLGEYVARPGDNEDENRMRYLELFYLACSDINENGNIFISNSTKKVVMNLAGLENRPDNELVGLDYTVNFDLNKKDEALGDLFILCVLDEETGSYLPITNGSALCSGGQDQNYITFNTKYTNVGDIIVARGIFTNDGLPTAIREVNGNIEFYRQDPKIVNANSLGMGVYYQTIDDVKVNQNIVSSVINTVFSWFSKGNKTLTQTLIEKIPRLWVDANLYLPYGVENSTIYHLENGSCELNYMFNPSTSIDIKYLYSTSDLNVIILVFASYFLFTAIGQVCWAIIQRIYDITLLFIIHPLTISTIPLTEMTDKQADNSPYSIWRSMFTEKVMNILGLVLGLTIFFMFANIIENMELIKEGSKIAEDLNSFRIFAGKGVPFMNQVLNVIFLFAAILTVKSAPKLFSQIMGFSDIFSEGESVKSQVDSLVATGKDVVSGQIFIDKYQKWKDNLTPEFMKKQKNKKQKKIDKAFEKAVQTAKYQAVSKGVDPKLAERAAQALINSRKAMQKEEEADRMQKSVELERREMQRDVRHGTMDGKGYEEKEKSNLKKRKKKVKKFVTSVEKLK